MAVSSTPGLAADGGILDVAATPGLGANVALLDASEVALAEMLVGAGQAAVFSEWAEPGTADEEKHLFFEQVKKLNSNYPGGLSQYLGNARQLLGAAQRGENPLEGWSPSVPTSGVDLPVGGDECCDCEARGLTEVAHCCFVIPAGGLGERLGFSGVKFALPADLTSGWCVLEAYVGYIRAFENVAKEQGHVGCRLPLVIMASADTFSGITQLLEENQYFGLDASQVHILMQEKVAALGSSSGALAMESPYRIATKPHGHGDVHFLLHSHGIVEKWQKEGFRWVFFFQDTNMLYLATLLSTLGLSAKLGLQVNSVAMPRKAKEAVGAIAKLSHKDGIRSVVVNVEYNQLEPLLLDTGHAEGDVNAADGFSPYPGNQNALVFSIQEYAAVLKETRGQLPEFINPKYADATRTAFKSPTRLECMMQDYPKVLDADAKVGFTRYPLQFGYFPCKNDIETAAKLSASGVPPHGAASAEAAVYHANCCMLRMMGAAVAEPVKRVWHGGEQLMGPSVVFAADFAPCFSELRRRLVSPGKVSITLGSSLIVKGRDVEIEELVLDGALDISVAPGASLSIKRLRVSNRGHEFIALTKEEQEGSSTEELRIRGYRLVRHETERVHVTEAGAHVLEQDASGSYSVKRV